MDGDIAPLVELAELAEHHDAMLLVDEAHATGVFGTNGRGVAEYLGVESAIPVRVGTLSKALGSSGGFVVGPAPVIAWLANKARSYFFSTAPPDPFAQAARQALRFVKDEPQRRETLLARAADVRTRLRKMGLRVGASQSQIISVVLGDASRTMAAAAQLKQDGIFVPGIRPPSVPANESLLRISLTYAHAPEHLERLVAACSQFA
jgi:7-keto-8-aminopelargonate synthetase-like enzyme